MNHGDVWWLEHPQLGRRPACVLTRQSAIDVLHQVTIVPATRTVRDIPSEVAVDREDGMPDACVFSLDNLQPVPKAWLTTHITRLRGDRLDQVCRALDHALGC